jgi:hypothetical protein
MKKKSMSIHDIITTKCATYDYSKYGIKSPDCYWYEKTMRKKLYDYFNSLIKISPQLHKLIYNEDINPDNLIITDNIFEHIKYMHCYAGGFNNNDYDRLPISFKRHTYNFVKDYSHNNTVENHSIIMRDLCKKYHFPENYANVIGQNWLYKPNRELIYNNSKM